jgi:hypothetical protein
MTLASAASRVRVATGDEVAQQDRKVATDASNAFNAMNSYLHISYYAN